MFWRWTWVTRDTEVQSNKRRSGCQQGRSNQTKWLTVGQIRLPGATGQPLLSSLVNEEKTESGVKATKGKQKIPANPGIRRTRSSFSDLRAKKTFLPFWFWSFPFCYEDRIWPWQPREQRRKHVLTQRERTRRSYLPHAKCVSCAGIVACRCLSTGGIEYSCGPSLNLVKLLSEAH